MSRRPDPHTYLFGRDMSGPTESFWLCKPEEFYRRCRAEQARLRSSGRFARVETLSIGDHAATAIQDARRRAARKRLIADLREWA